MTKKATTSTDPTTPAEGTGSAAANTGSAGRAGAASCDDREGNITRSLLGYGVLAGPVYVAVSLAQAFTRDGFDLARHEWSLLANGDLGWIQITNFVVTALMVFAFAVGLRRVLRPGFGATWAPRLVAGYGAGLVAAAAFRADPAMGFPAGTPDGPGIVSWHGMLHLAAAGVGFLCLVAACVTLARRFARAGRRGWAAYSAAAGALFLAGFGAVATGGGASWANLTFVAAILIMWTWVSATSVHLYRGTRQN
jgi:hypothetical protein